MANAIVTQVDEHAPWQTGEIITLKVERVSGATYFCVTQETYPADLKERHADELEALQLAHQANLKDLGQRHAEELQAAAQRG